LTIAGYGDWVCPLATQSPSNNADRALTKKGFTMRTFVTVLVLLGCSSLSSATPAAAQSDDCKLCREDHQACVKAHSQGACKANYDICIKHCRRK
jgi:hypothetical protein